MKKHFTLLTSFLAVGLFFFSTTTHAQVPANDLCANAIAISCNSTISGTTTNATSDTDVAGIFCETIINTPGVWYTVEGTGGEFIASTCNQANYDTKISVFTGDCGSLNCIGGRDDYPGCGLTTEYTWLSEDGTTYFILVHGFGGQTGDFDLTVSCLIPAEISVDPDEFAFLVPLEGSDSDVLEITNSGETDAEDLNWSISKFEIVPTAPANGSSGEEGFDQAYVINTQTLSLLSEMGITTAVVNGLQGLLNRPVADKEYFAELLQRTIGQENYQEYGSTIMGLALSGDVGETGSPEELLAKKIALVEADKNRPATYPPLYAGGLDAYGYSFIDSDETGGPVFSWTDISSTGTEIISNGDLDGGTRDDGYKEVALPFTFNFYGIGHSVVKVSSNGYLTFGGDGVDFGNDPIPDPNDPNDLIGPFWDDLNPGAAGTIHYFSGTDQFIVQYTGVPRFPAGGSFTFQVILNADGTMLYQYLTMSGILNSSTIGIENVDGTVGLEVAYLTNYVHDNLAVLFQLPCPWLTFSPSSGTTSQGNTDDVTVSVDAAGLDIDTYTCNLTVLSNAANENPVVLPVTMYVGTPLERIDALIAKIEGLNEDGVLNNGQANAFIVKLEAAKNSIANENYNAAIGQLNAFINQVMDFMDEGILTEEQGNELIADAQAIIDILMEFYDDAKSGEVLSDGGSNAIGSGYSLEQNRPNPFNGKTTITFSTAEPNMTTLKIYNSLGQEVAVLFHKVAEADTPYTVEFDGSKHPKGIYFYHLQSGDKVHQVKKMVLTE